MNQISVAACFNNKLRMFANFLVIFFWLLGIAANPAMAQQTQAGAIANIEPAKKVLISLQQNIQDAERNCRLRFEKGLLVPIGSPDAALQKLIASANIALQQLYQGLAVRYGKTVDEIVNETQDSSPCQQPPPNIVLRIHGSNTVGAKATPALAEAFLRQQYPGAKVETEETEKKPDGEVVGRQVRAIPQGGGQPKVIEIKAHGSATAFAETADVKSVGLEGGFCDIGQSSRPIKDKEAQQLRPKLGDLKKSGPLRGEGTEHIIALDGIAIIVHPSNPVDQLAKDDLKAIFSRSITDWKDVPGFDRKLGSHGKTGAINLYRRDDNSGTFDAFVNMILGGDKKAMASAAKPFADSEDLSKALAQDPNGIGFIGMAYIGQNQPLAISERPGKYAVKPDRDAVRAEKYPLFRKLYLYLPENSTNSNARRFVELALSDQGQDIIENKAGLIGVRGTPYELPLDIGKQPPNITSPRRATAVVGREFLYQITANPPATRFRLVNRPDGITINLDESTGQITARFPQARTIGLTLQAENAAGAGAEAVLLVEVSASAQPPVQGETIIRLHGSNTIGSKLAVNLAKLFFEQRRVAQPEVKPSPPRKTKEGLATDFYVQGDISGDGIPEVIEIQPHGSGEAFTHLQQQLCEIGMASRKIKQVEATILQPFGDMTAVGSRAGDGNEHIIGWDGIAVIVHPSNPVKPLTDRQLGQIFSGKIKDWREIGGRPQSITLYTRDNVSGTYSIFKEKIFPNSDLPDPDKNRFQDGAELSDAVAKDPGAIGFVSYADVRSSKMVAIKEGDAAEYLLPNACTVPNQNYMLSRPLYLYIPSQIPGGDANANHRLDYARQFIQMVVSPAGQAVVEASGFFNREVCYDPKNPKDLKQHILFYFDSFTISDESRQQIETFLTRYLANNPDAHTRGLVLKGYADSVGSEDYNRRLSEQRAQEVSRELRSRGLVVRQVQGLGESNPVRSNDTEEGRRLNRRVEIWRAP